MGSSPRMRGTQTHPRHQRSTRGIIPAYAGNTGSARTLRRSARDHPRVCGEHWERTNASSLSTGSSPRMRGTPDLGRALAVGEGIIPAYAGNTGDCLSHVLAFEDHPRVCGEHYRLSLQRPRLWGSSPRMRGTLTASGMVDAEAGIIPAYAGNTCPAIHKHSRTRDHPRVCGEHLPRQRR